MQRSRQRSSSDLQTSVYPSKVELKRPPILYSYVRCFTAIAKLLYTDNMNENNLNILITARIIFHNSERETANHEVSLAVHIAMYVLST